MKKLLIEEVELSITDKTSNKISILIEYNGRNAGIIMVAPSLTEVKTIEIVGIEFKDEYKELHVMIQTINSLWGVFKEFNAIIVAPELESVEIWNKLGFNRISPNYLIRYRGH